MEAQLILKGKARPDGTHTIYLYARVSKQSVRISTKIHIQKKAWHPDKRRIKGRSDQAKRQNSLLTNILAKANQIITQYALWNKPLTPDTFKEEMAGKKLREDFLLYYERSVVSNYERGLIKEVTKKIELRVLGKIRKWRGAPTLPWLFSSINRASLEDFDRWHANHLKEKGHVGHSARRRAFTYIRKYLHLAKNEGYEFQWPFHGVKLPKTKPTPRSLSPDELKSLVSFQANPNLIYERMLERAKRIEMTPEKVPQYANPEAVRRVQRTARWFLFSCFTGVRYSDMLRLSHSNLFGEYLVFTPMKTETTSGKEVRLKLLPSVRKYIQTQKGFFFPYLTSNQKYNKALKHLGELFGAAHPLTAHQGRHTFVSVGLSIGIPAHHIKEMIGVTSIQALIPYLSTSQARLDKDVTLFVPLT